MKFAWNIFLIGVAILLAFNFWLLVMESYDIEDQQEAQHEADAAKYGWEKP